MASRRKGLAVTFAGILLVVFAVADEPAQRDVTLSVAIFAWLPDASSALEKFEAAFEAKNGDIDLDLELINPYRDKKKDYDEFAALESMSRFDVVEIDAARLDDLVGGMHSGLDDLPADWVRQPTDFVAPAVVLMSTSRRRYLVPHWVCGNFMIHSATNSKVAKAQSLEELLKAWSPQPGAELLGDLFGGTTLGEYYADAVLDLRGADFARQHLKELAASGAGDIKLLPEAEAAILSLVDELPSQYRVNLKRFHDIPQIYPKRFQPRNGATLLGYSERLYYFESEVQADPFGELPTPQAALSVRQIPFGKRSVGTPSWVDGFVVPRGRLSQKRAAIRRFLDFALSDAGYGAFLKPGMWRPATYLLPALKSAYSESLLKEAPLLQAYRAALDGSFVIDEAVLYRGLKAAGDKLENTIEKRLGL